MRTAASHRINHHRIHVSAFVAEIIGSSAFDVIAAALELFHR